MVFELRERNEEDTIKRRLFMQSHIFISIIPMPKGMEVRDLFRSTYLLYCGHYVDLNFCTLQFPEDEFLTSAYSLFINRL